MEMKQKSFLAAMKDYFGYKPGQTMQQFAEECRELDDEERKWFKDNLASVGYIVI